MASRKVNIDISTKADTTGAKGATKAIDDLEKSTKETTAAVDALEDSTNKATASADRLEDKTKGATKAVDLLEDTSRQAAKAVDDLAEAERKVETTSRRTETSVQSTAAAMQKLETSSTQAAASATTASKGTSRVGQVASQAGFQVQDFAVQVAGGTSALTAMAQQAPQFLGVFGPGGAIAGALIAVGAIAAKVFMGMRDDSAATAEQAALLADAVEKIGENAEKAVSREIDFGLSQIVAAAEQAENLIDVYDRITTAQNANATAALSNIEKLREAELELARLRGEQVDEFAAIAANAEADAAARELAAQQQIAAQNEQLAKARQQEEIAQQLYLATQSQRIQAEIQRQEETKRLEILRAQRDALAEQAKERGKFTEGDIPFMATPRAEMAQKQLEDPAFQALIAATEARVNALDAQLAEQGGKLTAAVDTASQALIAAQQNTAIVAETLAIEVPKIQQTLQAETVKAEVGALAETGRMAAEEIKQIAESAKPQNSGQAAAVEALKGAVQDGVITANETAKVAMALQTLNGSINTGIGGMNANVNRLIEIMGEMQRQMTNQQRKIDELQARSRAAGG